MTTENQPDLTAEQSSVEAELEQLVPMDPQELKAQLELFDQRLEVLRRTTEIAELYSRLAIATYTEDLHKFKHAQMIYTMQQKPQQEEPGKEPITQP